MTRGVLLALALAAQTGDGYRYLPVPPVAPGSTLYAYREGGPNVPVAADVFAYRDLQKAILAGDQKGIEELEKANRLFAVPVGTAVKVLQYDDGILVKVPSYEVRVLDGNRKDRKGWVAATWVARRVAVPAKRKRR